MTGDVSLLSRLLVKIFNEELGALPRSLLVPAHTSVSRDRMAFQNGLPPAAFDQVPGGLGDLSARCTCGGRREWLTTWSRRELEILAAVQGMSHLSSGLTCPQETEGHTAEQLDAPGRLRQDRTRHFPTQGSCLLPFLCLEGLPVTSLF